MGKRDFSDLEDQIRDTVKSALDAIDFAGIKKDINDKAEDTINEVKVKIKNKSRHYNREMREKIKKQYRNSNNIIAKNENKVQKYFVKRPPGSVSGILYIVFGSILSGALGILLIACSIIISLWGASSIFNFISLGVLFSFFAGSMSITLRGISLRNRIQRFRQYTKLLSSHNYCSIEELAAVIKKKNKFVIKDLRKMMDLEMFTQAHIDEKQTYFMLTDEVYENYSNSQEAMKKRNEDERRRQEELNKEMNDPVQRELRDTIEMGRNYIEQIKAVNDAIPKEEISSKLLRLQNVVGQIFKHIENNPKKLSEASKFVNHYLPMSLKLVNSYKELNDQPVQGDNIKRAKNEIEKAIDSINAAFEKLLDDLFEEIALDISTDISVLETLFTQEGLTKNDFDKK
ncbi:MULTISPECIES: 5-bromo-4-chloroindolyl phosphate hydrolysis family protein [unclassified Clostridium]|uniref:5-bromo-4-chloroindolyl phosphate hydrolysis family protein n=1 Tax=unclassified Clostridium TaxID=2614128 RepID=UPI000297719A|nr:MULTISPECIES: 5-bromo-4-chloroindolyl phosphate hydrolysis family protein [unclassified Clostridium]EKQ55518.1 MAG: 5-bromo-4-chloroindolyl phosphate hydrolysis protein [Clostridium sp. Maddingley MBC34-26]